MEDEIDLSKVPAKEEILELIEKLREGFIAMKVRALCKEQWKDLTLTEEYQEAIGSIGDTVDRGHIFEYSIGQFDGNTEPGANPGPKSTVEKVYKVKWSTYTDCLVDEDCSDRTAWGLNIQAEEWTDTELGEWKDRFSELLDSGDIASTEVLYLGMAKVHATAKAAKSDAAGGSYAAIHALSHDGSDDWQGDDAKLAHEQYGGVIKQAGDNFTAMALTLSEQVNNDLLLQATVHCALEVCVKQVHNTIRRKTYLDHLTELDVLGTTSVGVASAALKFTSKALGWVGFALTVLDFVGVSLNVDLTIERELNEDQFEEIKGTMMEVLGETESFMEETRDKLRQHTETLFDMYFNGVANGDPNYIPGSGI